MLLCLFTSETFWVAAGSIATASALVYTLVKDGEEKRNATESIKEALYFELLTNIRMLFSWEIERKPLFDVISLVRTKFIQDLRDQETFSQIQSIYTDLDYYKTFVENGYARYTQDGDVHTLWSIGEKQSEVMQIVIQFFGDTLPPIEDNTYDKETTREAAINWKDANLERWKQTLQELIEDSFK